MHFMGCKIHDSIEIIMLSELIYYTNEVMIWYVLVQIHHVRSVVCTCTKKRVRL